MAYFDLNLNYLNEFVALGERDGGTLFSIDMLCGLLSSNVHASDCKVCSPKVPLINGLIGFRMCLMLNT